MMLGLLFTISLMWLGSSPVSAEPGGEAMLETKTLTTRLFISAVAFKGKELTGAELVWIPKSIESDCLKRSLKECWDMDHQRWVDKPSSKTKKPPRPETPSRVLTTWVTLRDRAPENKAAVAALRKLFPKAPELKEGSQEHHYPTLESSRSVRCDVVWELWTNGEGFQIRKILKH